VPGFHHLFVCTGPNCRQDGAEETLQALQRLLEKENLTKKVRVTLCLCLGQCGNGPNMVIYPEGTWYAGLDEKAIEAVVQEHLIAGKILPRLLRNPTDG